MSYKPHPHEELGMAGAHLAMLEAQLPPDAHLWEPFTRLFNSIAAVRNRIRLLEAKLLPAVKEPA